MNESEFNQLAEQILMEIEDAVESLAVDIDCDTAGDILTLEFENSSQIIINKQTPLSQIWVAARSGGYHFNYDAERKLWCLNSDPQKELLSQLGVYCTEQADEAVELRES
ncbi:MAG: iron donor protein CyaY [Gammaproteobacteria bacterium]|nr:iron donor protein CyaY [Gammaproteobacteria bacterium]